MNSISAVEHFFAHNPTVSAIRSVTTALKSRAYLSGGVVRDQFIQSKAPSDWDIYVECSLDQTKTIRADYHQAILSGKFPGAAPAADLDLIPSQSIENSVGYFDFSMNAVIYDCQSEKIRDPFGGIPDIKAKRLRIMHLPFFLMSKPFFRFFRFAQELGFSYTPETLQLVSRYRGMMGLADPANRARSLADLMRYLSAEKLRNLQDLLHSRLLETFIPFVAMIGPSDSPVWDKSSQLEKNFTVVECISNLLVELPSALQELLLRVRYERSVQGGTMFSSRMNLLAHVRLAAMVCGSGDAMLGMQDNMPEQFLTVGARAFYMKKLMGEFASTVRADTHMVSAALAVGKLVALSDEILELLERKEPLHLADGPMHACAAVLALARLGISDDKHVIDKKRLLTDYLKGPHIPPPSSMGA